MKLSNIFFLATMLLSLTACNNKSGESSSVDTKHTLSVDSARSIIVANNLKLGSLVAAGDTTAWAGMYTADGCAYPAGMPKICGREAISFFTGYAYRLLGARGIKVISDEVLPGDGFFVEIGSYEMYDSKGQVIDKGKTLVVWKQEDGTLKLHRDFF